ncbi:flagellar assembly protein FliW [Desulfobacterota bacterium M19]
MENTAEIIAGRGTLIQTSRFGAIEIDEDKIITMTSSILGFPDDRQFILIPHAPDSPFWWLQAVQNPSLAFAVLQAARLNISYDPEIGRLVRDELLLSRDETPEILVILTIPRGRPQEMTANLLGPVVINTTKRLARQIVLDDSRYNPCWPLTDHK